MVGKAFTVQLWEREHSCLLAFHKLPWGVEIQNHSVSVLALCGYEWSY